jgi:mRNA interferase MazF
VVLSPALYNGRSGLAVCAPITNQIKGYPFEVVLPVGLSVSGAVLADQLKSLDWRARDARFIARLSVEVLREVLLKATALIQPAAT